MSQHKTARLDDGDLYCRHCDRHLARIIDNVFVAAGVKIYGYLKFFCASCDRGYIWQEPPPPKDIGEKTLDGFSGIAKSSEKHLT